MLADAETFGTSPELLAADAAGGWACDTAERADTEPSDTTPNRPAAATACC